MTDAGLVHTPELIDGQAWHRQYPATYEVPALDEIRLAIEPGAFVKIAVAGERFWVEVLEPWEPGNADGLWVGRVANDLTLAEDLGFSHGDLILFRDVNVIDMGRA